MKFFRKKDQHSVAFRLSAIRMTTRSLAMVCRWFASRVSSSVSYTWTTVTSNCIIQYLLNIFLNPLLLNPAVAQVVGAALHLPAFPFLPAFSFLSPPRLPLSPPSLVLVSRGCSPTWSYSMFSYCQLIIIHMVNTIQYSYRPQVKTEHYFSVLFVLSCTSHYLLDIYFYRLMYHISNYTRFFRLRDYLYVARYVPHFEGVYYEHLL